ncbi:hypothetical protein VNO78_07814 [Psophocarpus tetragonolobus]|uniref:PGR5-like protein 1A, chloroplastic n=1 Tax=Psophocarpus tetragonolobus TaxID=3891 RepID=A0AAN9XSS3_PSOTE
MAWHLRPHSQYDVSCGTWLWPRDIPWQNLYQQNSSTCKLAFFTLTCPPRPFTAPTPTPSPFTSFSSTSVHLCLRRRLFLLSPKATAEQDKGDDVVDTKILPYCSIEKKDKKSIGELEQEFLQALQAFYYEGKAIMSNEEFDNLKEELMWEGSSVVMLSSDEQKFLEASMAYVSGKPILTDKEFDDLKIKLKMEGSEIVAEGPRCSLRSRKVYSDLSIDYLKMLLLNVPATVIALGLFFFLDDLTGFEISYLIKIPEPYSFILTWFAAIPFILWLAQSITRAIVKDFLILKGPCPNCGTENTSFFGTILSVSSGDSTNNVKCENCETKMVYDSKTRLITLPEGKFQPTMDCVINWLLTASTPLDFQPTKDRAIRHIALHYSFSSMASINEAYLLALTMMLMLMEERALAGIFRPNPWAVAHATFYGDETGSATMGM